MMDSTYESADRMLLSSPMLSQANTATPNGISPSNGCAGSSTHNDVDYAPIASSRSSNRSKASDSGESAMRSEMPHRIANELNNIFKNSSLSSDGNGVSKGISVLRHSHVEPTWGEREHHNLRSLSTDPEEERDYVSPPPQITSTQYVTASCSISPAPKTEMDGRIRRDSRDTLYAPMIKQRATTLPTSNGGSNSEMNAMGVRPVGKSSLRDQLQMIRKENSTDMKPST